MEQGLAFLMLVVSLPVVVSQDAVTCTTQVNNCACMTAQGHINLAPLDSKDSSKPKYDGIMDYMNDAYSYNPCSAFSANGCSGVAVSSFAFTYRQTGVCQTRDSIGYSLGTQDSAKFGNDPYTNDLQITYTATGDDGVARTAIITLKCDASQEGSMTAEGEYPTGTYDLTLTTKYACPGTGPAPGSGGGGLSGGSVLLIIFFSVLFVYLIAGVLFNKTQRGATGAELVPNVEFWTALPGYAKDGCKFTVAKVRGCFGGGGQSGYDEF